MADLTESLHLVQFYDDDQVLTSSIATFLASGLASGNSAIMIATPEHRRACLAELDSIGVQVDELSDGGRLRLTDARETLDSFMVRARPDEPLFRAAIGRLLGDAQPGGRKPISAYGEMVDLLWRDGNATAAIQLEEMWNRLAKEHPLSLLCAYAMSGFQHHAHASGFDEICRQHDRVVAAGERSVQAPIQAEATRPISNRAPHTLEVELKRHEQLEAKLRDALAERQRAEQDLRDFLDNAVEAIHAVGPDGTILWANQAELDLLGYPRDEYLGRHVSDFYVDPQACEEILSRLLSGETIRGFETLLRRKDGAIRRVVLNANGLWENGLFVRSRCFTTDVTELRRAAETAERLVAIVDSSDDAIVGKDLNGVITSWNRAAERIFGYTPQEAIGRSIYLIIPSDRQREEEGVLSRIRRGEKVDHFETVRRRKDGTLVPISLTVSPIRDAGGVIIGASKIARDVSERQRHETDREQLLARAEQARALAERANRVKDEFLATLSHELRSPLNAISGWVHLAAGQQDEVRNPTIRRALEVIDRNVGLQLRLITDLLDVSSIVNGKLPLRADSVDVLAIANSVAESLRPTAGPVSLKVVCQTERARVTGDGPRLEQIVWNLLSNALKFTPAQGRVTLTVSRVGDRVRLMVQDTGEGISPEFLPHVFDRFRQADATTTRRHGGLGLGLAVAQHLVMAHGGTIHAESEGLGKGATFSVDLPAEPSGVVFESRSPQQETSLNGLRLLVVDDDDDARELLESMLGQFGARVTTAPSMAAALEALNTSTFDLLLSDLAMPRQDGYALIEAIRRDDRSSFQRIGAIAVTGHAADTYRDRALASGFDDYVTKPVDASRLVVLMQNVLRRRAQRPPR